MTCPPSNPSPDGDFRRRQLAIWREGQKMWLDKWAYGWLPIADTGIRQVKESDDMGSEIERPTSGVLGMLSGELSPEARAELQTTAMEKVTDSRFPGPVPRFVTELPFGGEDDEITDRIAAQVLLAEDPDAAQSAGGTVAGKDLVNRKVTVYDLRVMPGDKPGGWGAYLLLDVTVDDDPRHFVVNTGAKQVVTRLARAWADGALPLTGTLAAIAGTGRRGDPALTFIQETAF